GVVTVAIAINTPERSLEARPGIAVQPPGSAGPIGSPPPRGYFLEDTPSPCGVPEEDLRRAVGPIGAGGQGLVIVGELDHPDPARMPLERQQLLPGREVPELDRPAAAAAGEGLPIRREGEGRDGIRVTREARDPLQRFPSPESDFLIIRRSDERAIR